MSTSQLSPRGYVVSDLHIFGCSSRYAGVLNELSTTFANYSVVILNGDTFDFKRSIYKSSQETATHAARWIKDLCHRCPNTRFEYLLGNHDCHVKLTKQLSEVSCYVSNLNVTNEILRLGTSLFLHGDVVDLTSSSSDLAALRECYQDVEPRWSSKIFAHLVTKLRLNAVEYLRHSKIQLATRILRYLQAHHAAHIEGVRAVYFGHTHVPFKDFEFEGIRFYNSGSLIRGLRWMPFECDVHHT